MDCLHDILFSVLEFVSAHIFYNVALYEGYVICSYEVSRLNLHFLIVASANLVITVFHEVLMLFQLVSSKL